MKTAIMGCGVVGTAVEAVLKKQGRTPVLYDPPLGLKPDLRDVKAAFVCVPTPTNFQVGTVNLDAARECIQVLPPGTLVILRSTVPPGTTDAFQRDNPDKFLYFVPEFLTEATAIEDALKPKRVVIGVPRRWPGSRAVMQGKLDAVLNLVVPPEGDVRSVVLEATAAEVAKYAANTFYAVKVAFFNEIYDLCQQTGVDYEQVRASVARDPWTGAQHTEIFHGGYRGFGGKCLPKDARAFAAYARMMGVPQQVLEAAEEANGKLRRKS